MRCDNYIITDINFLYKEVIEKIDTFLFIVFLVIT